MFHACSLTETPGARPLQELRQKSRLRVDEMVGNVSSQRGQRVFFESLSEGCSDPIRSVPQPRLQRHFALHNKQLTPDIPCAEASSCHPEASTIRTLFCGSTKIANSDLSSSRTVLAVSSIPAASSQNRFTLYISDTRARHWRISLRLAPNAACF